MKTERYTMELEQKILFYTTPYNEIRIEVRLEEETFWMSQKQMAELFAVETQTINYHLKEIFKSKELDEISTIRKIRIVQKEGDRDVQREQNFYNLDAIISVGYRVNSIEATQFRIWATKTLREFIIKGFVLDDTRLKNGTYFGKDYFDELLEKIREIRASERRFYQKITDIYKECSVDYDVNSSVTQEFFQTVQNKLEFAITGMTAPEIIYGRANKDTTHMGLTTWKNSPDGKILKSDVTIAKNYLSKNELGALNRIVTMYLDFAENQAERAVLMKMKDWVEKLDAFLMFNGYEVLNNFGKVKKSVADKLALEHCSKFRVEQDINYRSDFDEIVGRVGMKNKE
jgi:hypothetical protein